MKNRRSLNIIVAIAASVACFSVQAQKKPATKKAGIKPGTNEVLRDTTAKKKIVKPSVFVGTSDFAGGTIAPTEFLSLIRQGITAKDGSGSQLRVLGFNFVYAERRLFENEQGEMSMQTELSTLYNKGDKLDTGIISGLSETLKSGDTIFISQVMVEKRTGNKTDTILGKEVTCAMKRLK